MKCHSALLIFLRRLPAVAARALWSELPLVVTTLLVWGTEAVRNYEGVLAWEAGAGVGEYACRLAYVVCQAAVLAFLTYIIRCRRAARALAYALVLLPAFVAMFLRGQAGMEICGTALQMALETDVREATSFVGVYLLGAKGLAYLVAAAVFVALIVLAERRWRRARAAEIPAPRMLTTAAVGAVLLASATVGATYTVLLARAVAGGTPQSWAAVSRLPSPHDPVTKFAFAVRELRATRADITRAVERTARFVSDTPVTAPADSLNVVLIVGESYIRSHCALYGYPLPTTPRLAAEREAGRLFCFDDAVSPEAVTSLAMRRMFFTAAPDGEGAEWWQGVFVPAVFRSAGFRVAYIDNQVRMETGATRSGQGYTVLNPMYDARMAALAYDTVTPRCHDYDLGVLGELPEARGAAARQFIVVHLKGQHFDAAAMYPHGAAFDRFSADDYEWRTEPWLTRAKRQHIADYDNATLYNDSVVAAILHRYAGTPTVAVYLSDHGEEVYDHRDQWGRTHATDDARQTLLLHSVPLFVWCSNALLRARPELADRLRAALRRPFTTEALPQLLFGVSRLDTPLYRTERDPLSPAFRPTPRLLSDGRDYDAVVARGAQAAK